MKSPHLALAASLLAVPFAAAAQADPWESPFTIQIGAFNPEATTTLRVDGSGGRLGTQVSFEGTLGGEDRKTVPSVDFLWRFNPRHGMEGSLVTLRRDGSTTLSGNLDFGDATFPVSTAINSKFDSDTLRLAYRYSPIHTDTGELGLLLGVHYTRMKTSVSASGTNASLSEEASTEYPLPTIGIRGSARFAGNWRITGFGQFLKLKIDEYDGEMMNYGVGVEWMFARSMFAGLGYDYYKYNLVSTKDRARGEFDYRFDGPRLYFGWNFR
jgi:opacity protein-like surface antigen